MTQTHLKVDWLKPLRNSGKIFLGRGAQALMGLVYVALASRALGVEDFGLLVLIHALIFGVGMVFQMQSWQALIKFGAEALKDNDKARFQALIKFTTTLDLAMTVFIFTCLSVFFEHIMAFLNIPLSLWEATQLYSFGLFAVMMMPTPQGILRLFDRFDILGFQAVIDGSVRLLITSFLFFSGVDSVTPYLWAWFAGMVGSRIYLYIMAILELKRQHYLSGLFTKNKQKQKGVWSFVVSHSLSQSLVISQEYIGLILSGVLLGPAASGLFKIAHQFADVLIKPAREFLMPAIYPDFAKFQASNDISSKFFVFFKILTFIAIGGAILLALLALLGYPLIKYAFGTEFTPAYVPMLWLAGAGFLHVLVSPLEPLLSTQGRVLRIFISYLGGTALFIVGLYIFVPLFDLKGTGIAMILGGIFTALIMALGLMKTDQKF